MSQIKKTPLGNNPAGKTPGSKAITKDRKGRRTVFIVASVVIALILIIVGVSLYFSEDAKYNRLTILTVNDTSIKMDYFLRRIELAGSNGMDMMQTLMNEQFIKIEAPRYVDEVSPENVDQALRIMASGEDETISESELKEWYRQLINEIDFSDSEYREMIATSLLTTRFHIYLAERVPTIAEQVYLYTVVLSQETANNIWDKEDAGEDVEELISEIWQDKQSEEGVEDIGWVPRGILPYGFDDVAFSLAIGDISKPTVFADYTSSDYDIYYYLLMVSEKAEARELDEGALQTLQGKVLDDWLLAEASSKSHEIILNYNSEIDGWINWQLAKE